MKNRIYLLAISFGLTVCNCASANDLKNAINKVESKLGLRSTPSTSTAAPAATVPVTGMPATAKSSLKSVLEQAVQKVKGKAAIQSTAATGTTAAATATSPTGAKQSVKVKVGKEILRQATKYEKKHHNKLLEQGITGLSNVIDKQK